MELVAAVGLVREPGFLYFLDGNAIRRKRMARPGTIGEEPELIWRGEFVRDPAYFYFIDAKGDVVRFMHPTVQPGPRPAPPRLRREQRSLPLSAADLAHAVATLPPELSCLLGTSARDRLARRGRWSALQNPELRALAERIDGAIPRAVHVGEQSIVELDTPDHRFFLAASIPRDQVIERLRAAGVRDDATMIEFFATFGESEDFVLPSRDRTFAVEFLRASEWNGAASHLDDPVVFLAPNGDRVLLDPLTGRFNWANHERERLEPAGESFADLMRRYLQVLNDCGAFDAFSAERLPPAP